MYVSQPLRGEQCHCFFQMNDERLKSIKGQYSRILSKLFKLVLYSDTKKVFMSVHTYFLRLVRESFQNAMVSPILHGP